VVDVRRMRLRVGSKTRYILLRVCLVDSFWDQDKLSNSRRRFILLQTIDAASIGPSTLHSCVSDLVEQGRSLRSNHQASIISLSLFLSQHLPILSLSLSPFRPLNQLCPRLNFSGHNHRPQLSPAPCKIQLRLQLRPRWAAFRKPTGTMATTWKEAAASSQTPTTYHPQA
jgi:hypothetical protein